MNDLGNHTANAHRVAERWRTPTFWLALCVVLSAGCGGSSSTESSSGVTNWLRCEEKKDCAGHPQATCSTDGYCLDAEGRRIAAGSTGDTDVADATDTDHEQDASSGATDSSPGTCEAAPELDDTCQDALATRALLCPQDADLPPNCIPGASHDGSRVWCCPASTSSEADSGVSLDAGHDDGAEAMSDVGTDAPDEEDTDALPDDSVDDSTTDDAPDSTSGDAGAGDGDSERDASVDASMPATPGTDAEAACLYLDDEGRLQLDVLHECLCPGWLSCDVQVTDAKVTASATTTPTDVVCPPACYVARATCEVELDDSAGVLHYAGAELAFTRSELPTTPPELGSDRQWLGACVLRSP